MSKPYLSQKRLPQFKKTWALAWPVIIANLSLPLLSLADAAILGHLDSSIYLAGVTAGGSLMAYLFWGFNFLSMGLSGFTSQNLGKQDYRLLLTTLHKYVCVALSLIVLVFLIHKLFITTGLNIINPGDEVRSQADLYLSIRIYGLPAIVFNSMLLGFFIGLQNTRISLYTLTLTQLLNIGFNLMFVYGLGMKTAGIAIGTVISEYLGLLLILWQLSRTYPELKQKVTGSLKLTFSWFDFRPIFSVSSHLFVRTFLLLSAFLWFNRMAASFGELSLAANGLLLAFFTFISHFLDGTAAAAEAQTGHAVGQNNRSLLIQVWQASALLNVIFMLSLTVIFIGLGPYFLELLTSQTDVLASAKHNLIWVALMPLTGGIAFWLDGVFIGARRSKDMRNSVIFAFAVFVSSSWLFAVDNFSLWLCFNAFFLGRSLWLLAKFYLELIRKPLSQ